MPVIKKTWEKDAYFIQYYSDHADPSIPTVDIGVPNTERGRRWLVNLLGVGGQLCLYMAVYEKCVNAWKLTPPPSCYRGCVYAVHEHKHKTQITVSEEIERKGWILDFCQ